ncbi:MAG: hypothetical protein IKZ29_07160 [Clostridiales bacterium]|nr:hypothetical protein [Clostridiales bacterium]
MSFKISVNTIQLVSACIIVLWFNASCFAFIGDHILAIIKFGIVALWFVCAMIQKKTFLISYIKLCFPLLIFVFLIILSSFFGIYQYFYSYFMTYFYIIVICALFVFYFQFGSLKDCKTIIVVFLIDFCIKTIRTYILLLTNPIIVRALSTSSNLKNSLLDGAKYVGIGNYSWCYQLTFISLLVFAYFDTHKGTVSSIIKWLIIGFIAAVLFSAQIAMALLMLVIFVFLYLGFANSLNKYRVVSMIICIILIILFYFNAKEILSKIISLADTHLAERFENLLYALTNNDTSEGDIGVRMKLYKISLDYFIQSPIWGSFGNRTFGFHSTFLDLLGAYGILGFLGIFGLLSPINNNYIRKTLLMYKFPLLILLISFIFFSVTNVSIWCDTYLVVCLIIPLGLKALTLSVNEASLGDF